MSKTMIAATLVVLAALGAVVAFYGANLGLPGFRKQTTLIVCQGETRQGCGGAAEHFVTCDTNMVEFMKAARGCDSVTTKKLSQVSSAGACGYATHEITCVAK